MATQPDIRRETAWHPTTAPAARNYPHNCWWVAAFSNEVGEALLGRWLLNTSVLLFARPMERLSRSRIDVRIAARRSRSAAARAFSRSLVFPQLFATPA